VAAMRSIIRNRLCLSGVVNQSCKLNGGALKGKFGCVRLFFGCRRRDADWLYFEEWKDAVKDFQGVLNRDDGETFVVFYSYIS
jgi:sulfite reductase alpha subunit-like flavoprotein